MINHANCSHEATPKDRAACRKARAVAEADRSNKVFELVRVFDSANYIPSPHHWIWSAASRFTDYQGDDLFQAAAAILDHFAPSGDEAKDNRRRANGYIITESPTQMLSITLRAAS